MAVLDNTDPATKRICLIVPSLGPGGMERVMSELACYFDQKVETEVHLILYSKSREIFYSIPSTVLVHKPEFIFKNNRRTLHTIRTIFFLRKTIAFIDPDVILSFGENWNNFVLLSLVGLKNRIYISDRAEPGLKRKWIQENLSKWLYPKASGIIVQTKIAKKIYKDIYSHDNIAVIGNPIRELSVREFNERENIILSVGRLIKTKHFDLLIKIFAKLKASNWKLVIVGGNSQRQNGMEELSNLIKELELEGRVLLTGMVANVEDYYKRSSIFAFTSSSEGFPNVIGEAMSAGLPVVAFDCIAGPSDMIEDGENGFLVPLFDQVTFQEKLTKLMGDEELRRKMGDKARESTRDFDVSLIAERYYEFILHYHKERADPTVA